MSMLIDNIAEIMIILHVVVSGTSIPREVVSQVTTWSRLHIGLYKLKFYQHTTLHRYPGDK